jgi:opacity protein-like surface antigen
MHQKLKLALLGLSCGVCYAGTVGAIVEEIPCMKEGLYVGAGIGGAMYNDKVKAYNTVNLLSREKSFNTNSALASAFIGLGHTWFDRYFLGLEANTYFPHHKVEWPDRPAVTATTTTFRNGFLVQNYFNLDLLPGYRVNSNWLVYGRAGFAFSDLIANQDGSIIANVPSFSFTNTVIGGRFGAGINYQLSQHIGAGVDYLYSYNPLTNTSFNDFNAVVGFSSHYNYVGFSLFYTV